jgi:hypothetical protein
VDDDVLCGLEQATRVIRRVKSGAVRRHFHVELGRRFVTAVVGNRAEAG